MGSIGFGSIDANKGDYQNGWDTDEFPTNIYEVTEAMIEIIQAGGFTTGGVNFDAKTRRNSTDLEDIFLAHIGGMDAFARGLKAAVAMRKDGVLKDFLKQRYASWDTALGKGIESGNLTMADLARYMLKKGEIAPNQSGRVEMLENIVNEYI